MKQQIPETVDEYISACATEIQPMLHALRCAIREAAPDAAEKISWGMATFTYHGNLIHFSAEKKHIGLHPAPSAIEAFREELAGYPCSKGTVRLPYNQPLPLALIQKIVRFRVTEQQALAASKSAGQRETPTPRPRYPMPEFVAQALGQSGLLGAYYARPPYQQNDYLGWILHAKRAETREKRLAQMLNELQGGDAYMGMPYRIK